MSTVINEILFNDTNNFFSVTYYYEGSLRDFSTATRIEFTLNGTTVNSVDNPAYFDTTVKKGRIDFKLGAAGFLAADSGKATVKVFDPSNPLGVKFSSPSGPTIVNVTVV